MSLEISYAKAKIYSLAAQHNSRPLLSNLCLAYEETDDDQLLVIRDLKAELSFESELIPTQTWDIAQLSMGEAIKLQERVLRFDSDYLFRLSDPTQLKLSLKVLDNEDQVLVEQFDVIDVLPANYWGGETVSQSCLHHSSNQMTVR